MGIAGRAQDTGMRERKGKIQRGRHMKGLEGGNQKPDAEAIINSGGPVVRFKEGRHG